jgi:hypothetical protein
MLWNELLRAKKRFEYIAKLYAIGRAKRATFTRALDEYVAAYRAYTNSTERVRL